MSVNVAGDGEFIASIDTSMVVPTGKMHLDNYTAQGEMKSSRGEAINSAVWHALHFFVVSHHVTIVDPSFIVLRDLNMSYKGIINELVLLYDHAGKLHDVGKNASVRVKDTCSFFHEGCKHDCCRGFEDSIKSLVAELDNCCVQVYGLVKEIEVCVREGVNMYSDNFI